MIFLILPSKHSPPMKKYWILALLLAVTFPVLAQKNEYAYQRSLGIKMFPGAISYKKDWGGNTKIEANLYISSDFFRLTGLYEKYFPLTPEVTGLNWFMGGGAHWGIWTDNWKARYPTRESGIAIGVDGIIGLDYKIRNAPLNISLDWQPSFNIIGYQYFEAGWGGIGIRYVLN